MANVRLKSSSKSDPARWILAVIGIGLVGGSIWLARFLNQPIQEMTDFRPIEVLADGYVSSHACRECHAHNHETWSASYHRTMTQIASPETVLASFANKTVSIPSHPQEYHLSTHSGMLWMSQSTNVAGQPTLELPIVLTTGSHHMQIYWYATGVARTIAMLPIIYLKEEKKWIPRAAAFLGPPHQNIYTELGRWNKGCINCHATHGNSTLLGVDGIPMWDTKVAEFGISCEACHGPGENHIRYHRNGIGETKKADPIVNPAKLSHKLSAQVCGSCHSANDALDVRKGRLNYLPGDDLTTRRFLIQRDDATRDYMRRNNSEEYGSPEKIENALNEIFWKDGVVRVTGREYSSLRHTACHQKGTASCLSCHAMHQSAKDPRPAAEWANDQLQADKTGQQGCVQCHDAKRFAAREHTHHATDSSGSQCYNCHMPHTSYGLLKAVRNHAIDSPDAKKSATSGRPNACNLCHLDKSLDWTAEHLSSWYGIAKPILNNDQKSVSAAVLGALRGDVAERALIAWHFGWEPAQKASGLDWMPPFLSILANDPYDAVRFIAGRSMKTHPLLRDIEFDFIGTLEHRETTAMKIFSKWINSATTSPKARNDLLLDVNGNVIRATYDRLVKERDHTPINLLE